MKLISLFLFFVFVQTFAVQASTVQQNDGKVSGKVVNSDGEVIPGVTVVVKGTTVGTTTDFDGLFQLSGVKNSDVLKFSFVGMKTIEVVVTSSFINVSMEDDAIGLDEVIAIGYGTMKKSDLTGAVSSVTSEQLTAAPVADVAQALKGKLAGVNVVSQDGRPGADISIRVRGGGSISQSNDPLFIVDGFPVSTISNIPASQIESINVLKDASSTAIYGARGANGVIMVTTKSGTAGKLSITYDGYMQLNTLPTYLEVMDGYDYIAYNWAYASAIGDQYADAWERMWAIGRFEGSNSAGIDYYKNVESRNFMEELYTNSTTQNHNLNITGGNETSKFLLALNHIDQEGTKVGSSYQRTNFQFKLDQKLGDKLTLSVNTRFYQTLEGDNDGNSTAYWFRPIATEDVLGDMDITSNTQLGDYNSILQDKFNPISILNDTETIDKQRSLIANTSLSWEILNGLTFKTDLGLNTSWDRYKTWDGAIKQNYLDAKGDVTFSGDARIRAREGWSLRWANTLNYDVQGLGDDHKLNVLVGMEVADSGSEETDMTGKEYPAAYNADRAWANMNDFYRREGMENFKLSSKVGIPNRLLSYFGRVNYTLMNKYLLTGTMRYDGSSRFAPDNRWAYFPAGAIAWRVSEESFLEDADWLDNLKLRASVGSVGSDGISADLWRQSWASGVGTWSINETLQPNYTPASDKMANQDLIWETTITRNLGLDFAIFNGKLSGTLELYKNTVKDLLLVTPISEITGFTFSQQNIGATSNKGIELALNTDIIRSKDFNLRASVNLNINRGNVDELAEGINGEYGSDVGGVRLNPRNDYYLTVGEPVGLIRGYVHDGWYTTDDFNYDAATQIYTIKDGVADVASGILPNIFGTFSNKPGSQSAYPGVQKLKDISGPDGAPDGVVDDYDIGVIGDTNPAHTGGLSISGNYKNFDFGLDFNWSYGNDIYNATHVQAYLGVKEAGLFRNRFQELAGHYKIYDIQNGQLVPVVEPAALDALNANATTYLPYPESAAMSTFGVEDGSYLRLNTVTLGYTLPKIILDKIGIEKIRIYGSIYNALTWTNYSGFDPEVNVDDKRAAPSEFTSGSGTNAGGYPTPGLDFGMYPRARTFTLGVNIAF